ncbi:MATE family efflux transporter [Blattabacterium cuenoti]|uniref:MATE family efflux transporter n=1 Tax=Blattabacterium cuenoti TaxID=1653831 RepID=UPI001EEB93CF
MVGNLGDKALASTSLANSIFFILIIFGLGISNAISSLIASVDAKKKYKEGYIIFYHGFILNLFLSILMYGLIHVFFYIFPYLGQPKEILNNTTSFLRVIAISFIPWMLFEVFRKFSEGISLTYPSLIITWSSSIINVLLNYIFIHGSFGFPKLGLVGVAYSTLISRIIMLIGIFILLQKNKKIKNYYNYYKLIFLKKKYFYKILKIGIPSGLHTFFEISTFAISSFISGKCGVKVLAAHQIVINLASSTYLLIAGLSITATIRMSSQLSLKNYSELRIIGNSIFYMGIIFMFICSLLFIIFKEQIPYIYMKNDNEVFYIAKKMIVIASVFQIFDGLQGIILGALRGLQDVKIPMYISFFSYWIISLPTSWYLSKKIGGVGVWIGLGIGIVISAVLLFIRYNFVMNNLIKKNN